MAEKSRYERLVDTLHGWQQATSPWNIIGPQDVAGMLPGGGIPQAVEPFRQGTQKTAAARQAFSEGRYGDALTNYASGFLDTASAGLNAAPEVGPLMNLGGQLAAAFIPAKRMGELPLEGGGLHVYHGTGRIYDAPQLGAPETTLGSMNANAHYVTAQPEIANGYAEAYNNAFRKNTEEWAPQVRMYRMGDANTLSMTPDEYFLAKRAGAGEPPKSRIQREEAERYAAMLQDAFGEVPSEGETFADFLRRKGVDRAVSGGGRPEEVMVINPETLAPRFGR